MTGASAPRTRMIPAFGRLLKQWRAVRGLSQLDLALEANVSSRHLSFIETGRSRPSANLVLRLAEVLQLSLKEQNELLEAAGHARRFPESSLVGPSDPAVERVIGLLLEHQEPLPAVAMDRHWNIVRANDGWGRLWREITGDSPAAAGDNMLRALFAPGGPRTWISNWREVAHHVALRVRRALAESPTDNALRELVDEILEWPDVRDAWYAVPSERRPGVILPLVVQVGGGEYELITTLTTLGAPHDAALQELQIETFFPGDDESEQFLASLQEAGTEE